ncbi:unnamed protein product, partial [Amoebophrya sp. A120]
RGAEQQQRQGNSGEVCTSIERSGGGQEPLAAVQLLFLTPPGKYRSEAIHHPHDHSSCGPASLQLRNPVDGSASAGPPVGANNVDAAAPNPQAASSKAPPSSTIPLPKPQWKRAGPALRGPDPKQTPNRGAHQHRVVWIPIRVRRYPPRNTGGGTSALMELENATACSATERSRNAVSSRAGPTGAAGSGGSSGASSSSGGRQVISPSDAAATIAGQSDEREAAAISGTNEDDVQQRVGRRAGAEADVLPPASVLIPGTRARRRTRSLPPNRHHEALPPPPPPEGEGGGSGPTPTPPQGSPPAGGARGSSSRTPGTLRTTASTLSQAQAGPLGGPTPVIPPGTTTPLALPGSQQQHSSNP